MAVVLISSAMLIGCTAQAIKFDQQIDGIKSIVLNDLEGNKVDKVFSKAEEEKVVQAFNDSFIMDTSYIEMITGNTMTIILEDGRELFIHSYGDENYIVAAFLNGQSYHLGCQYIGQLLLGK